MGVFEWDCVEVPSTDSVIRWNHTKEETGMSKSERVANYVYIVGHERSGTTLLELLLAQHPEIVDTGELSRMSLRFARDEAPYFGCSCGMRPHACPVWAQVADAIMREYTIDIVSHPFRFRISDVNIREDFGVRSFLPRLLRKYRCLWLLLGYGRGSSTLQHIGSLSLFPRHWARNRLFITSTIGRITGTTMVIDGSKDPFSMMDLYRLHQGNMKVIFITRDVRGNVWSHAKLGDSVSTAARSWSKVNYRTRKRLRHITSSNWTQVKYEYLCVDPANVINEL